MSDITGILNNDSERSLGRLIALVDPDSENVSELVEELKHLEVADIWIGCSNSSGEEVRRVFEMFPENTASLYPGNFDQILKCLDIAKDAYFPNPLIYNNPVIDEYRSKILEFLKGQDKSKVFVMDYIVLDPNSSAARLLGLTRPISDEEVLELLLHKSSSDLIYLEAGSGNNECPIINKISLIEAISKEFPDKKVIAAGGIASPSQAMELAKVSHYVLVSSAMHNDPSSVSKYLEAVR